MIADREVFSDADRRQLSEHGLAEASARVQLEMYARGPTRRRLLRPCTVGDGIRRVSASEQRDLVGAYEATAAKLDLCKFVPASGAATRMFKVPLRYLNSAQPVSHAQLVRAAAGGDTDATELEALLSGIERLPFHDALVATLKKRGVELEVQAADVRAILACLLREDGLGYAELPKALLPFHRYPDEVRTPLEEQLVEAAEYARGRGGSCRVHYTVSVEHLDRCRALAGAAASAYGRRFGVQYDVSFSLQKSSTDTMAVDEDDKPFRDRGGRLVLRPAGHGALIENLAELDADLVFIKNIDNVQPDHLREPTRIWKRTLGALALELQASAFELLRSIGDTGSALADVDNALEFAAGELAVAVPDAVVAGSAEERRRFAAEALDRPVRVGGMVVNQGEPGGGPFWVDGPRGATKQIVEASEVDMDDAGQRAIVAAATHFNPVDLVCALRGPDGKAYDLARYVDESAYLVVEKSHEGRPLRSLELPGLWNGTMAGWNTLFVEVPLETFSPVKTVNDLLRPAHQPI